ncbi:hypothetical protein ABE099_14045 [Paenibacillus turicensis]|uniref:hypothetical protein n=1 Tax=Paenibacillus turicensis TaxID=160487 RepID=UPI003D2D880A
MKRKILSLIMAATMSLTLVTPIFASGVTDNSTLVSELEQLSKKYNIEITHPENSSNTEEKLKFDSVKEFEAFIIQLQSSETEESLNNSLSKDSPISLFSIFDSGTESWWSPAIGNVFSWKNIVWKATFRYDSKGNGSINTVTATDSYLTGVNTGIDWKQTLDNSYGSGDTLKLKVNGYYLLGLTIEGYELGAKVNGSWSRDVKISLPSQT